MGDEIWILGATGRIGRGVAARLSAAGVPLVLHGRDSVRVEALAAGSGGAVRPFAGSLSAALEAIADTAPAVVVNTIGPFVDTAEQVVRACPTGTHYVDMGNELAAAETLFSLDGLARSKNQALVASAGFGVYGTEAALLHALDGAHAPARVRVDSIASVATDAGAVGQVLARTIVNSFAFGGRAVRGGRLVKAPMGSDPDSFVTPDGDAVTSSSWASNDLLTAWRTSDAAEVVAASALNPTGAVRRMIPAMSWVVRLPGVGSLATRMLARLTAPERPAPRAHTWARAVVEWPDGRTAQSWLRAGEAMDFTVAVTAETALRLSRGEGKAGAFTPGALFGTSLASAAGADFVAVAR